MNKKLNRLLRPHMGFYFAAMGICSLVALVFEQYWLGAMEGAAALALYGIYSLDRAYRQRELQKYLQEAENTLESSSRGDSPFPAVMVRLGDGGIVWANPGFC